MDAMTAMTSDLELARELSKNSTFVSESRKNPHFQKMISGMKEIAATNNHLNDEQLRALERKRKELFVPQLITRITDIDSLTAANKDTVEVTALLGKRKKDFLSGELCVVPSFMPAANEVLVEGIYGGTTGLRTNSDGTANHLSKRVGVASDIARFRDLANMSFDDKIRAVKATRIVDSSGAEDPYVDWKEESKKVAKAREERLRRHNIEPVSDSSETKLDGDGINWGSLV